MNENNTNNNNINFGDTLSSPQLLSSYLADSDIPDDLSVDYSALAMENQLLSQDDPRSIASPAATRSEVVVPIRFNNNNNNSNIAPNNNYLIVSPAANGISMVLPQEIPNMRDYMSFDSTVYGFDTKRVVWDIRKFVLGENNVGIAMLMTTKLVEIIKFLDLKDLTYIFDFEDSHDKDIYGLYIGKDLITCYHIVGSYLARLIELFTDLLILAHPDTNNFRENYFKHRKCVFTLAVINKMFHQAFEGRYPIRVDHVNDEM